MRKRKFIKAYKQFREPIYRFVYFKVSQREIAEDLASEVFLKTWHYSQTHKIKNLRALSYKIARNLIVDYYKKHKPVFLEEQSIDIGEEDKNYLDIQKALSQLPKNYREVIELYYIEGFSHKEIALILNKKDATIRVLASRGLKKLKEKM